MTSSTFAQIRQLLDEAGITYRVLEHPPTRTSEESARVRGESLAIGGKALLLKVDAELKLVVLSAARKLHSASARRHFGARKVRFATAGELLETTGLVPGSVPPFGPPILPFPLFVDSSVLENDRIAFNAGALTRSIIMATADYLRVAKPEIVTWAARPAADDAD